MPPNSLFNQIDFNCTECFLFNEIDKKEIKIELQGLAQNALWNIINTSESDKYKTISKVALEKCKGCNFSEPEIHKYLDIEKLI